MRSVSILITVALSLFAGLSAAAPGLQSDDRMVKMIARNNEMEPSAMFSNRQIVENPSRVKSRKRAPQPSTKPPLNKYNIELVKADGSNFGYLSSGSGGLGSYTFTKSKQDAIIVTAPTSMGNLPIANSNDNIGAVVGPGSKDDTMAKGSANYLALIGTVAIPPGTVASKPRVETAMWHYSKASGDAELVWTNPDKSTTSMVGLVGDKQSSIVFVGDEALFTKTYSGDTYHAFTFRLTLM